MKRFLLCSLIAFAAIANAQIYNILDSFSTSGTTNGPWSLCYRFGVGGTSFTPMNLLTTNPPYVNGNHQRWTISDREPLYFGFYRNFHPFVLNQGDVATSIIPANDWMIHPDDPMTDPVCRFIAPTSGEYKLNYSVARLSLMAGTTKVFVFKNGTLVDSATAIVDGYAYHARPELSLSLAVGDIIDFETNNDGPFVGDSTGLRGSLSTVPEPASLLALGLGALALMRRRRYL